MKNEHRSVEFQQALQWRKLQSVLAYAYQNVPFYQRRFDEMGAHPADIKTPEDFRRLAVVTRQDILEHTEELLACPKERLVRINSGGSTGHPLAIYTERGYLRLRRSLWRRVDGWIQANTLWPCLELGGLAVTTNAPVEVTPLRKLLQQHYRYSFQQVTEDDLRWLARVYLAVLPRKVIGFPSIIRVMAEYMKEQRIQVARAPKVIGTASETLYPEDRNLIEEVLGGPVYNRYATRETTLIAAQCLERTGLHVLTDHVYLELIENGKPVQPGKPGQVVVTDLDRRAMPFIRYQNEDIASWARSQACPCGRKLPLLDKVYGRGTDFIHDKNGAMYPGLNLIGSLRPVAEGGHVRQYQLLQAVPGQVRLLVVPGPHWQEGDVTVLRENLGKEFHQAMEIDIQLVARIPAEPSGKTSFVKSQVPYDSFMARR